MIGRHAVHAHGLFRDSPEEVAAAHDDPDLAAGVRDLGDFLRNRLDEHSIDAEAPACSQGFTR